MNILQVNSSLHQDAGQSTRLANRLSAALVESTGASVTVRDLARTPIPHLDAVRFAGFSANADARSAEQDAALALSDELIAELRAADVIVVGAPMYNFGIPSQLKAYFDHVARAGATFRYTEKGPQGLLTGKRAYVITTRGGKYAGTPGDTIVPYLRMFLRFLGITYVEFIFAEGIAMGDASRQAALSGAETAIAGFAQTLPLAA